MDKKYILRVGLSFTLLYAGISAFLFPFDWVGFVPGWVTHFGISQLFALHLHSAAEILLGLLLLTKFQTKIVAWLIAIDILVILLVNGFGRNAFLITFRDVGLLAMAVYLAVTE